MLSFWNHRSAVVGRMLVAMLSLVLIAATVTACGDDSSEESSSSSSGTSGQTEQDSAAEEPDAAKVTEVLSTKFETFGMVDDWANYGEIWSAFAEQYGVTSKLKRTDPDISSGESIARFDAEKNNPKAIVADIGIPFGALAEAKGVGLDYSPPGADALPEGFKSQAGGWIAPYAGVPSFSVNAEKVKNVPQSWKDLLKPEYKGKIGYGDPRESGTAQQALIAAAIANGGSETDLGPGYEFFKKLKDNGHLAPAKGDAAELEKGTIPIQIKYNFVAQADKEALAKKGIEAEVVIPEDGSHYAPSLLLANKYYEPSDVAKAFMEFVLTDEAQRLYAKIGALPIKYVTGDLELTTAEKKRLPTDDQLKNTKTIEDWSQVDPEQIAAGWEAEVLG